jgi:hypothetical protein
MVTEETVRVHPTSFLVLTESLKPLSWPADKKRRLGIRVSMSIRHSVLRSVAVISSSCSDVFSHSTCITCSLIRSETTKQALSIENKLMVNLDDKDFQIPDYKFRVVKT